MFIHGYASKVAGILLSEGSDGKANDVAQVFELKNSNLFVNGSLVEYVLYALRVSRWNRFIHPEKSRWNQIQESDRQ